MFNFRRNRAEIVAPAEALPQHEAKRLRLERVLGSFAVGSVFTSFKASMLKLWRNIVGKHEAPVEASPQPDNDERHYASIVRTERHIASLVLEDVFAASEPEVTPDGKIYELDVPDGVEGDLALVDMADVTVDTPHYHDDETEVHFPVAGGATMYIGGVAIALKPGDRRVIYPRTTHFIQPGPEGYAVAVLNLPNYDPARQIPVATDTPSPGFDPAQYAAAANRE